MHSVGMRVVVNMDGMGGVEVSISKAEFSIMIFVELGTHSIVCFIKNARHVGNKVMDISMIFVIWVVKIVLRNTCKEDKFYQLVVGIGTPLVIVDKAERWNVHSVFVLTSRLQRHT